MESTLKDDLKTLEELFYDFEVIDQKKIWIRAFRRAAAPLVNAAKANVPRRTGKLERSIGVSALRDEIGVMVGARRGGSPKGWHGHLVESGTKERFRRTKNDAPTGRVTGTQFFERAFESTNEQMYDGVSDMWYEEIDRFIMKAQKRKL